MGFSEKEMKTLILILICVGYLYPQGNTIPLQLDSVKNKNFTFRGQKNFSVIKVGADTADVYKRISQTVNIEEYIGALDTSLGWSLVIQAAIDANLGTGNNLFFNENKVYELQVQKDNPYESSFGSVTCIDLKTGGLSLIIPQTTTLKLKDDQQTGDTFPVDIIVFYSAEDLYIGGGGRITGNTAGQTGWTGGYEQQANGRIIGVSGHGERVNKRITIENLRLDDHFSNPIDINGGYNINIRNIDTWGVGEGIQFINVDYGTIINCSVNDSTDVFVGDGIELSNCRFWILDGCRVSENGNGSAFDIFASSDIILTNFFIHKWVDGISPGSFGSSHSNNIFISNGHIDSLLSASGTGVLAATGFMVVDNVIVSNSPYGLQMQSGSDSLNIIKNCIFRNTGSGILVTAGQRVYIENSTFINTTYDGVQVFGTIEGEYPEVRIKNCNFMDIQRTGVYVYRQNVVDYIPEVSIINCFFKDNVTSNITVYDTDTDNILYGNNTFIPAPTDIASLSTLVITTGILDSLGVGNENQLLTISFEGDAGNGYLVEDWRVSGTGGDNIQLYRAEDARFTPGDKLTLQYQADSTRWYEISRSHNTIGGEKFIIDGWYYDNTNASMTDVVLLRGAGTITNRYYLPKDAYFTGMGIVSNEARTAGTLTATLWINGTTTNNKFVTLDGTNTTTDILYNGRYNLPLSQFQYIDIRITTSGDWEPATADIQAWIEVEY
jgi:hypothetical protein